MLEAYLPPKSELWMFNEVPETERESKLIDGGLNISDLKNIRLVHEEGNAVIRRHLENLPLETFDSVSCIIVIIPFRFCELHLSYVPSNQQILILADESVEGSIVHSDSRSLATLLLIRDIQVWSL